MDERTPRNTYRHSRLKQLRAFCRAAQERSISRAAERLGLSQPSVSLQIQALERELGVVLFERRGRRIRLTEEGESLYEMAAPLVEGIDALPQRFAHRNRQDPAGRLELAAGESAALYVLPGLLGTFMARHPRVQVRVRNLSGADVVRAVQEGDVDLGVGSGLDIPDDVAYCAAYTYELKLIAPVDHPLAEKQPITLADLGEHELILPPRQSTTWRLVNLVLQQHSVACHSRLEVGGWEILKRYVELGFAPAIISSIALTGRERLAVRDLPAVFPQRTYGALLPRGRPVAPQTRYFLELMAPQTFGEAATHAPGAFDHEVEAWNASVHDEPPLLNPEHSKASGA